MAAITQLNCLISNPFCVSRTQLSSVIISGNGVFLSFFAPESLRHTPFFGEGIVDKTTSKVSPVLSALSGEIRF